MDGIGTVAEYAQRMKEINQQYLCVTDHGVMGAVPQQVEQSEKHGLYPIFGCELYCNPMQPEVQTRAESAEFRKNLPEDEQPSFDRSPHIVAVAYTNEGYSNLVRMCSWGWIHGFYRKPRINHDVLRKYKEGIIFTTACAASETAVAFFKGGEDAGFQKLEELIDIIGKDHLYLEINMLDFKDQRPYNQFMIRCHDRYGLPLVLTQDCHYAYKDHSHLQRLALMSQSGKTIQEIQALIESGEAGDIFELQDTNLWCKSEDELNQKWESDYQDIDYELYKQAKANSVEIARRCKGVEIDRSIKLPQVENDRERLMEEIKIGFKQRHCPDTAEYQKRIEEEYQLICDKGFASYFLITKEMLDVAREEGKKILGFGDGSECVGPGRGSVCGSLVAYCLRLHDVEPIINELRFSRFLSPARGGKQMRIRHTIKPVQVA